MFRVVSLVAAVFAHSIALAKDPPEPCRTRSRQMTLVKNCYTGDMAKPSDGGGQFFSSVDLEGRKVSYCFNSLIKVESKAGELRINVLKDNRDGKFYAYNFSLPAAAIKKAKHDLPLVHLKGLKGACFSKNGDREACQGGILKAIGWKDIDAPMLLAMGKSGSNYTVSHIVSTDKEPAELNAKEVDGTVFTDSNKVTENLLQEIRRKISHTAKLKMSAMHSGTTNPKKMAASSEQFRYCTLAFEGYLRFHKLNDPFSPEEKMTLATLTNYMNDAATDPGEKRMPASTK